MVHYNSHFPKVSTPGPYHICAMVMFKWDYSNLGLGHDSKKTGIYTPTSGSTAKMEPTILLPFTDHPSPVSKKLERPRGETYRVDFFGESYTVSPMGETQGSNKQLQWDPFQS